METHNNVRPPSTLTVLEKSRELHILLSKVTLDDNLLQKAFRFTVGKAVTDHSQDIYESLAVANSLDLYDKELTEERLKYQTQARRAVTKLLAALRIMYSISQMPSDKMKILIDKTIEVERLLKKWMESDRNRVGANLGIVKKDEIDTSIFSNQVTAHDLFAPAPHIDFDILLKDSRHNLPPVVHHDTNKLQFIPPGECIQTPAPAVRYVTKTESERVEDIKRSRFELDAPQEVPPMPMIDKPKSEYAIRSTGGIPIKAETTKPVVEVVVPDKPIIVPDDRIKPDPNAPTKEELLKMPISSNIEILKGATPDSMTEDEPKSSVETGTTTTDLNVIKKDEPECPSQPIIDVQPGVSITEPKTETEPTATPVTTEKTSESVQVNPSVPSLSNSTN